MAERLTAESAAIRELIARVDTLVRDAAAVRSHMDRVMRRRPFWPDRRHPKRWSSLPDHPHAPGPAGHK